MKSIQLLLIVAALLFITSFPVAAQPYGISEEGQEFVTNPVTPQRADPWVYKHTDGYYYFTGSVPAYDRIELRRAETLQGLAFAEPVTVRSEERSVGKDIQSKTLGRR